MTPEENLKTAEQRYQMWVDGVLGMTPPTGPWSTGDAIASLGDIDDYVKDYRQALIAIAHAAPDVITRDEYMRRSEELPGNVDFLVDTILGYWRRRQDAAKSDSVTPSGKDIEQSDPDRSQQESRWNLIQEIGALDIETTKAKTLGLQYVDLAETSIDFQAARLIPIELCRRYNLIAIRRMDSDAAPPGELVVAVGNIDQSMSGLEDVRLVTHRRIIPVLATAEDINDALDRIFGPTE